MFCHQAYFTISNIHMQWVTKYVSLKQKVINSKFYCYLIFRSENNKSFQKSQCSYIPMYISLEKVIFYTTIHN